MGRATYEIVHGETTDQVLVIRDSNIGMSVTNDAEGVVDGLRGQLRGRRLMYYDSDGQLDELVVVDGRFAGFLRPHV